MYHHVGLRPIGLRHNYPIASLARPRIILRRAPSLLSRSETTDTTGDHHSGHIETKPNEGVLFFNNVFPLKLQWLLRMSLWNDSYLERLHGKKGRTFDPVKVFERAMPPETGKAVIQGVIPRLKDGAAFLKFSHSPDTSPENVEQVVKDYLLEHPERPVWNPFDTTKVHLVRGRPWIEDLFRIPTGRLKVEFYPEEAAQTPELSHEELFGLLREYGKILEIYSQPTDSKALPKYATIDFATKKAAIMAKNCLHGLVVQEQDSGKPLTKLKISYERGYSRTSWIRDWMFSHPRVVIPLLAALAAVIASVVFDPLRNASIKIHINRAFHLENSSIYKWFASRAKDVLGRNRRTDSAGYNAILSDRKENIEQIEKWLMETADTFIIVQGPRGSGKRELVVDQALKSKKNQLIIDCKKIQDARGDSATIDAMAAAVGYRPVFSWLNSISGMVDMAVQGATGVKTGFSETLDGQMTKILNNTSSALRSLALQDRKKSDKDAHMAEDDYLEAHPEKRPVVVLDNYLHKSLESSVVYDKLADWAAGLSTSNTAHVMFLTTEVSFSKSLSKALPDRVFRQLSLGDLPADAAKRFVISHLDVEPDEVDLKGEAEKAASPSKRRRDLRELDGCISSLGGRLTDLEFLARRIRSGESPGTAVREIIDSSATEILKMYILGDEHLWAAPQAWALIVALAARDGALRYNEAVLHPAIAGPDADAVLAALEQAELIAVHSAQGRPSLIRPGKPVFLPAFRRLAADRVLSARLDLALAADQLKTESASIAKNEDELRLLGSLPTRPAELDGRIRWLLAKIAGSQNNVQQLEKRSAELKTVMQTEY